jgi:cell division protein FtsX
MALLTPHQRLLKNLRQEIPIDSMSYMSREEAYLSLKQETGQDFGYDDEKWENWLNTVGDQLKWRPDGKKS